MENPDVIMLLCEIQKVAVISAETRTSVDLLRSEVAETKKKMASCDDVERAEKDLSEHLIDHEKIKKESIETRRWSFGAFIAAVGMLVTVLGGFFGWGK